MTIEVHLTKSANARVSPRGWRQLPSGKWVTFEALIDTGNAPHFAHLHRKALREVAERIGARMLAPSTVIELNRHGRRLKPVTLPPDSKMSSKARCDEHDAKVRAQIDAAPDDERPVSGGGKPYIDDSEIAPRQATIFGWATRPDSSSLSPEAYSEWLQPLQNAHANDLHSDYSSIHQLEADSDLGLEDVPPDTDPAPVTRRTSIPPPPKATMPRSTIRLGSKGPDVTAWQMVLGVKHDGHFGPATQLATEAWQKAHGLAPDGIVGARSWAAAGQPHSPAVGPGSPACRAALRDANAAWPGRKRISDGIMGDARHMLSKSDHNSGNAVDITHDPASGCDGDVVSRLAMLDPRVTYVIWDRRIWNPSISPDWRPYKGSNGHTHHCHISVSVGRRDDDSPWPWASGGA